MPDKKFKRAIFVFRRDLRIDDNTGLRAACSESDAVFPVFILDPRQCEPHPYRSEFCLQFMIESLEELSKEILGHGGRLSILYGDAEQVLQKLISEKNADAVFLNKDYTLFSQARDKSISDVCKKLGVQYFSFDDVCLNAPGKIFNQQGSPYTVFTAFWKNAKNIKVPDPVPFSFKNLSEQMLSDDQGDHSRRFKTKAAQGGGRSKAIAILESLASLKNYAETRDIPALENGTSHLSPHNKFGTLSIREVFHFASKSLGPEHTLLKELYWRDFFTHVGFHFPHVYGKSFNREFDSIKWNCSEKDFLRWCEGTTGFPIVDAGMRQLNETGRMHNRVRMIVASFLVKDLHIDWRKGERYFAQKLVDYDPAVNNGNWQWAASTGCDAQPYFRIFNPWLQQKRFDPDCIYIKRWIPELKDFNSKMIHALVDSEQTLMTGYPAPMLEHKHEAGISEDTFADAKKKRG